MVYNDTHPWDKFICHSLIKCINNCYGLMCRKHKQKISNHGIRDTIFYMLASTCVVSNRVAGVLALYTPKSSTSHFVEIKRRTRSGCCQYQ